MRYYSTTDSPTLTDRIYAVLEDTDDFPKTGSLEEMKTWTWEFVYHVKKFICKQDDNCPYRHTADDVKRALIKLYKDNRIPKATRIELVKEYNRALGSEKFHPEWPDKIQMAVEGYENMPSLNKVLFKNSKHYPRILAAIYMAGNNNQDFIFAMPRYSKLLKCPRKTIYKLINKLLNLGILTKKHQGIFASRRAEGKSSWYSLEDPRQILDLFCFKTAQERERFVKYFNSPTNSFNSKDWGLYVITRDWLSQNNLQ